MRLVIQRVLRGEVWVEESKVSEIQKGLVVFIGVSNTDTFEIADRIIKKMVNLRIFEDDNGKTNLDLRSVNGELMLISQFTLYANCKKGNRPSFIEAGVPEQANELYEYMIRRCVEKGYEVKKGVFGADMKITLQNDGPFTIILDSDQV